MCEDQAQAEDGWKKNVEALSRTMEVLVTARITAEDIADQLCRKLGGRGWVSAGVDKDGTMMFVLHNMDGGMGITFRFGPDGYEQSIIIGMEKGREEIDIVTQKGDRGWTIPIKGMSQKEIQQAVGNILGPLFMTMARAKRGEKEPVTRMVGHA